MSSVAGELVTERLGVDAGGRQVTVYVPPAPAEAVVFAGDGQLIPQWSENFFMSSRLRRGISSFPRSELGTTRSIEQPCGNSPEWKLGR